MSGRRGTACILHTPPKPRIQILVGVRFKLADRVRIKCAELVDAVEVKVSVASLVNVSIREFVDAIVFAIDVSDKSSRMITQLTELIRQGSDGVAVTWDLACQAGLAWCNRSSYGLDQAQ